MIADLPPDDPVLRQFRDDPYPLYRYLQAAAPVQWNDLLGAWTLARYVDVVEALTDPRYSADRTLERSEERRVGKECTSRRVTYQNKKTQLRRGEIKDAEHSRNVLTCRRGTQA